nr:uncharacterized protein LOC104100382 [Nicotiana tomentosiformis]
MHNAYCAKVCADEDDLNRPTQRLTLVQAKIRKDRNDNARRDHPTPRPNRERHQPYAREAIAPYPRYEEGPSRPRIGTRNDREMVYAMEKLRPEVKWSPKMRSDSNTRKSDALCEFHQERGHKTEDCITLRQEVVNMLRQGHLKELLSDRRRTNFASGCEHHGPPKPPSPARTINMIISGSDDISINNMKFSTTHKLKRSITHEWYNEPEESIIFDKSDADSLTFAHSDALIIILRILDTDVKRIMTDDGSGACIIHP